MAVANDHPVLPKYAKDFKNMNDLILTHYVSNMLARASKKVRLLLGQRQKSPLLSASALFLEALAR